MVLFKLSGSTTFAEEHGPGKGSARRGGALGVAQAAYNLVEDDVVWSTGVLKAAEPVLGQGLGVYSHTFTLGADDALKIESPTFLNCPPGLFEVLCACAELVSPREVDELYRSGPACQSISQVLHRIRETSPALENLEREVKVQDILVLSAREVGNSGYALAAPLARRQPFPNRMVAAFERVARHIAAARRLRQMVLQADGRPALEAEAVIDRQGRVLHAEGEATGKRERAALAAAAGAFPPNEFELKEAERDKALELWHALVAGRWTLVSSTDNDGKRLILARRNQPQVDSPAALSMAERHVVELVAQGQPMKLIAYELGLSLSTVSERLKSAVAKLGLRSRTELVRFCRPRGSTVTLKTIEDENSTGNT